MRKSRSKNFLCSAFVLICLLCGEKAAKAATEPFIRVLIGKSIQARIRSDGAQPLLLKGIGSGSKKINSLNLSVRDNKLKYKVDNSLAGWKNVPRNTDLRVKSNHYRGIWLGKRRYGGELRIALNNNKIQVVNYIKVEKYLQSVVGSEMPKSWPIEALKAQAIAARTYALQQLGKKGEYDVNSNESSQVYLGLESETKSTKSAVRKTRKLVLLYGGKLINAVFHSSSGGQTEASSSVWRYQFPYLISVRDFDHQSPKFKWEKVFSALELKELFADTGGLNSIQVLSKSTTGRVLRASVYGYKGGKIISGKDLRHILNLDSTKAKFHLTSNKESDNLKRLNSKSTIKKSSHKNSKNAQKNNSLLDKNFQKHDMNIPQPLPLINKNYYLIVKGFGAGHGVGMSQWGAYRMAQKGASYKDILNHYYQGALISKNL